MTMHTLTQTDSLSSWYCEMNSDQAPKSSILLPWLHV